MNNIDFIQSFIPEWHTEFTFKVKSIKRLYPGVLRKHKLAQVWINEDDLLLLEKDLEEPQFWSYSEDWKYNYEHHKEESVKHREEYYSKIKGKIAELGTRAAHPIRKEVHDVYKNAACFAEPGIYTGMRVQGNIGGMEFESYPHALVMTNEMEVDVLYFNPKISLLYKNKWGHIEFMKFPIDHMLHSDLSLIAIDTGITAYILENKGFKIGKLISVQGKQVTELPYKKWEIDQMIKYYHTMKDIDYSKRFSR